MLVCAQIMSENVHSARAVNLSIAIKTFRMTAEQYSATPLQTFSKLSSRLKVPRCAHKNHRICFVNSHCGEVTPFGSYRRIALGGRVLRRYRYSVVIIRALGRRTSWEGGVRPFTARTKLCMDAAVTPTEAPVLMTPVPSTASPPACTLPYSLSD